MRTSGYSFLAASVLFVSAAGAAGDALEIPGYAAVPLAEGRHHYLVITLQCGEEEGPFSIDTGAPISVLDLRRKLEFDTRPAPERTILMGGRNVEVGVLRDLRAGSVRFGDWKVALVNLYAINRPSADGDAEGPVIDGILGSDLLLANGAVLDLPDRLALFQVKAEGRTGLETMLAARGYSRIGMERGKGGHLTVPCSVGGVRYRMIVDTGAFVTLMDGRLLAAQGIKGTRSGIGSRDLYGGYSDVAEARLDDFKIGGVAFRGERVGLVTANSLGQSGPGEEPVAGFLGQDTLRERGAILDFEGMNLFLRQN